MNEKMLAQQQTHYKAEYSMMVEKHMKRGYSFESFGGRVGVGKTTLYNWCAAFPEFNEAKKRGMEASRYVLERQLMHITKRGRGNVIGAIFMMKNRFPNEWRDRRDNEPKEEENVENLSLDEQIVKVKLMLDHLLMLKGESAEIKTIEA